MDRIFDVAALLVVAGIVTAVVANKQTVQEINALMNGFAANVKAATGR